MKNIKFLLFGTSLSFLPQLAFAQCVATQDCATLGYTETSCNGGKGVKCPFGNKWACLASKEDVCREEGSTESCTGTGQSGSGKSCGGLYAECSCETAYQYTCTGTGYAGGAGSACGGKYTQCMCSSGYEWKDNSCKPKISDGAHGNLFYCNGVVVGIKTTDMNFFIAMKDIGNMIWQNANSSCQNYSFCGNLKGALPTKDQLTTMYNNNKSLNSLLSANGGINLTEGYYWSSTNISSSIYHYGVHMYTGYYASWGHDDNAYYIRPVLISY